MFCKYTEHMGFTCVLYITYGVLSSIAESVM